MKGLCRGASSKLRAYEGFDDSTLQGTNHKPGQTGFAGQNDNKITRMAKPLGGTEVPQWPPEPQHEVSQNYQALMDSLQDAVKPPFTAKAQTSTNKPTTAKARMAAKPYACEICSTRSSLLSYITYLSNYGFQLLCLLP